MISISVIIPIYNVEEFIEECLMSVLKQTLKNIEIICVNDGTLDDSMQIIEKYAKQDDRIIIVNKENGGLSSARNAGLDVAQGEYVYFLDSDDYLKEETLQQLYELSASNRLDNIFFSAESFFENDEVKEKNSQYLTYYDRSGEYEGVYTGQELFVKMEKNSDFKPSACLQMARTDFIKEHNIRFYKGILHEDNLFTLQNMMVAKRVMCIQDKFYMRRVRDESIMTNTRGFRSSYGYYITIREFLKFVDVHHISLECKDVLLSRLQKIYNNVVDKVTCISDEEIEQFLNDKSVAEQLEYMVYVKHNSNCKQDLKMRLQDITDERSHLKGNHLELWNEIDGLRREVKELRNSNSYRIGHIIMYIPGKIKRFVFSLRDNGVRYTFRAIKRKIFK